MEGLSSLGGLHPREAARPPPPPPLTSSSSKATVQVYTIPRAAQVVAPVAHSSGHLVFPLPEEDGAGHGGGGGGVLADPVKAKIVSHPRYHHLLTAFLDCHKVGCTREAAEKIAAAARETEARQLTAARACGDLPAEPDPELDQFMEAYYEMLVACKEEMSRPVQEAKEFLRVVESQLNSISTTGSPLGALISEEKPDADSSDDDQEDGSGMETKEALGVVDPRADEKELKRHLLKKYSGYLGSLRKELTKKKKKGKLPKEARQKLLSWWELHYRWPYPSEMEKIALAESTGLEQKQINNWFINQRKRHWKPSEEMQFAVVEAYQPQNAAAAAAAFYLDSRFMGSPTPAAYGRLDRDLWNN